MPRRFKIDQLDQKKYIKVNELEEISNPALFNAGNGPTSDGLLSNEIFGITKAERAGIYAYIDMHKKFINPYFYKMWLRIDRNLRSCIYETQNFIIDSKGYLTPSDDGHTGLDFIIKNIDTIKFKDSKKNTLIAALYKAKSEGKLFTDKFVIIPPFYRDVNTDGGRIGVGEVNKLYTNLINKIRAMMEASDYGFDNVGGIRGQVQDITLEIYNWFTTGETASGAEHTGAGIFKKFGHMRRSVMAKTTDNSARCVISSPDNNVNTTADLMVDLDYSAIPLNAALVVVHPFIIYYMRQFFNNEFGGKSTLTYTDLDTKKEITVELENIMEEFSDERFDEEINEYIHGYSNRFKSILIPNKQNKKIYMRWKGYSITREEYNKGIRENDTIIERNITWLDVFYIAATKALEDKVGIIARYPIDSYTNQLYTKLRVATTVDVEPIVIDGEFYQWYPRIRQEDIGIDTSNKMIEVARLCNLYLSAMGADYDGDTVSIKVPYTVESNMELEKYRNSNAQFIGLGCNCNRGAKAEAIQAIYNLTLVLRDTELVDPVF